MSNLPNIMRTIAKKVLKESSSSKPIKKQSEKSCQQMQKQQFMKRTRKKYLDEESQQEEESLIESSSSSETEKNNIQSKGQVMNQTKQYFIGLQNRKLKLLYPTFDDQRIKNVAVSIWQQLGQEEKLKYEIKRKNEKQREQKDLENLQYQVLASSQNEKSEDNPSCHPDEKQTKNSTQNIYNDLQQQNQVGEQQVQLSFILSSPDSAQNSQAIAINQSAEQTGQQNSNSQTKTSSLAHQRGNNIALPEIFTLVYLEGSTVKDQQLIEQEQIKINSVAEVIQSDKSRPSPQPQQPITNKIPEKQQSNQIQSNKNFPKDKFAQ